MVCAIKANRADRAFFSQDFWVPFGILRAAPQALDCFMNSGCRNDSPKTALYSWRPASKRTDSIRISRGFTTSGGSRMKNGVEHITIGIENNATHPMSNARGLRGRFGHMTIAHMCQSRFRNRNARQNTKIPSRHRGQRRTDRDDESPDIQAQGPALQIARR